MALTHEFPGLSRTCTTLIDVPFEPDSVVNYAPQEVRWGRDMPMREPSMERQDRALQTPTNWQLDEAFVAL